MKRLLIALIGAFFAALAFAPPETAFAVQAGPFNVEGPASAYSYANGTLAVTGDGVTITGMAETPVPGENNVSLASSSLTLGVGSNVQIGVLSGPRPVNVELSGTGNRVSSWDSAAGYLSGTGSITVGSTTANFDVRGPAVTFAGAAQSVTIQQMGTVNLVPGSRMGAVAALGGMVDLTAIPLGSPISMGGLSISNIASGPSATVAVPFGTESLSQLVAANNLLISNQEHRVFSNGEDVGYLLSDGTIYYTATRTVEFVGFDGQVLSEQEVRLFQPAVAPEVPVPEGYRFTGWDADFSRVNQNMTVTALFEQLPAPEPVPVPGAGDGSGAGSQGASSLGAGRLATDRVTASTGDAALWCAGVLAALAAVTSAAAGVARFRLRTHEDPR